MSVFRKRPGSSDKSNAGPRRPENRIWSRLGLSLGGQIIYNFGQFGVLASISHIAGPEAVGLFGLALSVVTPIFVLSNMGLRTAQASDQEGLFNFTQYGGYRLITTVGALLLCAVGGLLLAQDGNVLAIILLYGVAKSFESFSELAYGSFERNERFELVFVSLLVRSIATILVFVTLLWYGAPLWTGFLAQVIVWGIVAFGLDLPAARKENGGRFRVADLRWREVFNVMRRTFPIGGAGFLTSLQPAILRLLIAEHLGLVLLGIFTSISYLLQAGSTMSSAMRNFLVPRFSRLRVGTDRASTLELILFVTAATLLASAIGLGLVYKYSEDLLRLAFGPETSRHQDLLMIVSLALSLRLLGAAPMSLAYSYGGAVRRLWSECALLLLVVAFGQLLIPSAGLIGAGWVLLAVTAIRVAADSMRAARSLRLV